MTIVQLPPFDLRVIYDWMRPEAVMAARLTGATPQCWLDAAKGPIAAADLLSTTRSSGINLPNMAGEYQSIGVNELPRTNRGLYANGQFTNLALHSNDFADDWWSKTNFVVGAKTGDFTLLTAQAGTGIAPQLHRTTGSIIALEGVRSIQLVVKPVNHTRFILLTNGSNVDASSAASGQTLFELSGEGQIIASASLSTPSVRRLGDGSYLIVCAPTTTGTSIIQRRFQFAMVNPAATGVGSGGNLLWNPTGTEQVLVRDAQAFDGIAFPVEAAIRTADATDTLYASDIRAVQGVRPDTNPEPFAGWETVGLDAAFGGKAIVTIDRLNAAAARFITGAGVDADNLTKLIFDTDNRFKLIVRKSGVDEVALQTGAVFSTGDKTIEWQAKPGDYSIDATGVAGDTDSDAETLPTGATTLRVGSDFGALNPFNGLIKELQILKVAA